jgi:hypothetical protein
MGMPFAGGGRAADDFVRGAKDRMFAYAAAFSLIVTVLGVFLCVRAFLEAESDLGRLALGAVVVVIYILPFFVRLPIGGIVLLVLRAVAAVGAYVYLKWKGQELL